MKSARVSESTDKAFVRILDQGEEAFKATTEFADREQLDGALRSRRLVRSNGPRSAGRSRRQTVESDRDLRVPARDGKGYGISVIDAVVEDKAAEQQHLGCDEHPHAEFGRLVAIMRAASVGLIVYAFTVSLAGVDWLESLEPDFHSSIRRSVAGNTGL